MLGKVSVAVFVDETEDGPSATDPQGLIEGVEIATDNIDLGTIELNASLGTLYQVEKENDKHTSPMPEILLEKNHDLVLAQPIWVSDIQC